MVEKFEITSSSEKAQRKMERAEKYPFSQLQVGQSFAVPQDGIYLSSLRNHASLAGRRLGRKFSVIQHGKEAPYEVARIK